MLSRRRRAFHLRRVMLAAGLWMKLRKRRDLTLPGLLL